MNQNIDDLVEGLLKKYKENPFEMVDIYTPHTGIIKFYIKENDEVKGTEGAWAHIPGTLLFTIEREKNIKKIHSPIKGVIHSVRNELDGSFVEANEKVVSIKKQLNKLEVLDKILMEILIPFKAPDDARYYLVPDLAKKIEAGARININEGDELIIMSLMKRDTILRYSGEPGIIEKLYFEQGQLVEKGKPLLGICPIKMIEVIERIKRKINLEWDTK